MSGEQDEHAQRRPGGGTAIKSKTTPCKVGKGAEMTVAFAAVSVEK